MISDFNKKILASAEKRQGLLKTMQETEYASKALNLKSQQVADAKYKISEEGKILVNLHAYTEQERHKVDSYHNSVARKGLHSLGGAKSKAKFAARGAEEERAFTAAQQREKDERVHQSQLNRNLEDIEAEKRAVESDQTRHTQAQKQLSDLYESIFRGPTPEVEGEDELEDAVNQGKEENQRLQIQANNETHAMEALSAGAQALQGAMQQLQSSNTMATVDIFAGGDLVDLMERQRLAQAQGMLDQCIFSLNEARRLQPAIPPLPDVFIDQGHILSNVLFNCAITDFMQQQRIQQMCQQMAFAVNQLQGSVAQQQMRVQSAQAGVATSARELERASNELWGVRSKAFDRVCKTGGK